jgi:AcrR family transcriptional regulator
MVTSKPSSTSAPRRTGKRDRLAPADRRVLLMGAAARTFARLGFAGTRMDDIAEEANVAKGLLYRHFPSKEALFHALMEESGADFTRRLQHSWEQVKQAPDAEPWDVVDAGLNTFLDEASDPDTMLNWVEPAQWELVSAYRDQTLQAIVDELVEMVPDFDHGRAWLIAAVFQGALEAGVLEWRRRGGVDREELFGLVHAFSLRGLDGIRAYYQLPVPATPDIATRAPTKRARRNQPARGASRAPG